MTRYGVSRVDAVIPAAAGAAAGTWYITKDTIGDAQRLMVMAPASLEAAIYTIEVSDTEAHTVARTLTGSDGTTAVALPAAGKACDVSAICASKAWRIKSSASTLGATFELIKQFIM